MSSQSACFLSPSFWMLKSMLCARLPLDLSTFVLCKVDRWRPPLRSFHWMERTEVLRIPHVPCTRQNVFCARPLSSSSPSSIQILADSPHCPRHSHFSSCSRACFSTCLHCVQYFTTFTFVLTLLSAAYSLDAAFEPPPPSPYLGALCAPLPCDFEADQHFPSFVSIFRD